MPRLLTFTALFLLFHNSFGQEEIFKNITQLIQNPEVFEINQLPGHASLLRFSLEDEKFINEAGTQTGFLSLNGIWKFLWNPYPGLEPDEFFEPEYDASSWSRIEVPSNWQMKGFGYPKFRNVQHPFPSRPPFVPEKDNPTGSYKRKFYIPVEWDDKRILLHFDGVQSASIVWINGMEAGYNQGGMEPAEYDITRFIKTGENDITVNVYRYCDGTYLEDQDMWRLSGIYRDVYLLAVPETSIRDYLITTDLINDYRDAVLDVRVELWNTGGRKSELLSLEIKIPQLSSFTLTEKISLAPDAKETISFKNLVKDPLMWSAEKPNLYELDILLGNNAGEVLQKLTIPIGFREIEYRDKSLLINGKEIKLNGVNSHMQHPDLGHAMNTETIRKDFMLMKEFNINCVRTSHYPPEPAYPYMASKYGIYLIDETGDEAHATEYISDLPVWRDAYVERVEKLVLRDRNHPSVIIWSAGNESGRGENICAVIERGKQLDSTRPRWMYGGNQDYFPSKIYLPCEGIMGPRYPFPHELRYFVGKDTTGDAWRTSFMDEYLAATGNGLGGLDEYWEVIRDYKRTIGGAIWDWMSPGITAWHQQIEDRSEFKHIVDLQGKGTIIPGKEGSALRLSGHDSWVEVYRDPALDITGNTISVDLWIKPGPWNGSEYILSKGKYQYGFRYLDAERIGFYVGGRRRAEAAGMLTENWQSAWHHLAGIYDGKSVRLFIDGRKVAEIPFEENIINRPFPVCLGWNPEIYGMEYPGYTSGDAFDNLRIFNKALSIEQISGDEVFPVKPLLILNFDSVTRKDPYYSLGIGARSYGTIWPDRTPQPEMWQIKKSAQPLDFSIQKSGNILNLKVKNNMSFTSLSELDFSWELLKDGYVVKEGNFKMNAGTGEDQLIEIKTGLNGFEDGENVLTVSACLKHDVFPLDAGYEIAWEQFELTGRDEPEKGNNNDNKTVSLKRSNGILLIEGENFAYELGDIAGKTLFLRKGSLEIRLSGPVPNLWHAPIANELDEWTRYRGGMELKEEGMGNDVANGWRSVGLDKLDQHFTGWEVLEENEDRLALQANFLSTGRSELTSFESRYIISFYPDGIFDLEVTCIPNDRMPEWLPKVGIQFEIPKEFRKIKWYGRGPFETYPDRKTGAKLGIWSSDADNEFQPYLIPQDYGNHAETRWMEILDDEGKGLRITGKELFNFSLQKFSAENLTRAKYPFQLKENENLVLNLDHRVTGVGGNAIGVLNRYKVYPQLYNWKMTFTPLE